MLTVRRGEIEDLQTIERFVNRSEAIYEKESLFIVVEDERKEIVGVAGIQLIDHFGWLRSFVFSPRFPSEHLLIFLERVLVIASEHDCTAVYLATNKQASRPLFEVFGFSLITAEELPEQIKLSTALAPILQKKDISYMWKMLL
ncbi:MAG: GNAT family N-acetyltransferase [Bacillus sp. (in: firmicutes)]